MLGRLTGEERMTLFQRIFISAGAIGMIVSFLAGTGSHIPIASGLSAIVLGTVAFALMGPSPRE